MISRRKSCQDLVGSLMKRSSVQRRRKNPQNTRRTKIEAVEQRLLLSASDFIINEINADPDTTAGDANGDGTPNFSDDEFVEFVNNGAAQDIGGWTINDGAGLRHTFASPTNVAAGQAVVVFGGGTPTGAFGGAIVVTASSGALGLNNGGDTVTLSDGTNNVAETYGSEGGRNNSLTRNPDLTGTFVEHDTLNGGTPLFSPGVQNDGVTAFGSAPAAAVVVTQSGGSTTVTEGGATDTIDVSLNQAPTADVTVTLTPASADIDLGSGAGVAHVLTFTPANATNLQTVTVTAIDDADVEGFETVDVTFTTASADTDFNGLTVPTFGVGVNDNEIIILTAPYSNDFEANAGAAGLGADWTVFSVDAAADNTWAPVTDSGDRLAEANAFGASAAANDWLISPAFNLDATSNEVVALDTWTQFADTGQGDPEVTFLYSTNFTGTGDPTAATWTSLSYTAPAENTTTTTPSGAIDVSAITGGQVYFAFQYQSSGTGASSSSRWRVDDFSITEATNPGVTVTESGGSTATAEGGATDSFTVVLNSAPTSDVTITLTPDAQVSLDVTTLTFTPANALTAQTVTVTAVDDSDDEGSHSGLIQFSTVSADTAYNSLSISDISVTIADNDGAVSSAGDVVFNEIMQNPSAVGDAAGEFFELWNTTGSDIDINGWSIEDDSGATGETHVINNGGPLVITANGFLVLGVNANTATNGGIDVDYVYSGTNLGNGSDGLVLKNNLGTIIDAVTWDDGSTFPDPNGASMELIPTVSAATAGTANDTGSNWQVSTNTLASGDSATPGAVNSTPPVPTLSIDDVTVDEGTGTAGFTVTLSAPAAVNVTVDYATADDTATAPADYTAQSSTLTFAPGETSKTISVLILDDAEIESSETFHVNLTNASGADATIDDALGVGTISASDAPSFNPGDVVVNEVMQNPAAVNDADGEYFELRNTTGAVIDINGWSIEDESGATSETHVIDNGGPLTIPANGFLVLGLNDNTATNGNVSVDYVYSGTSLGNSTDGLVIKDGAGTTIDAVTWDNGATFPDPNGASMELIPTVSAATAGTDNDSGSNWQTSTATIAGSTDMGTPGAVNSAPAAPEILINELMINPEGSDTGNEYVELRGTASTTIPADVYLVVLEGDSTNNGVIDHVFTLDGMQFGSNGFLVLLQAGNSYTTDAASSVVTATGTGWGTDFSSRSNDIENGSTSFLLIQSSTAPTPGNDVDSANNGTLDGDSSAWTILDSVGNIDGGADDTGYGAFNVSGNGNGSVPAGATLVNISAQTGLTGSYHPDYLGRIGNSNGSALADWVLPEVLGTAPNFALAVGSTVPSHLGGAPLNHIGAADTFLPPKALFVDITPTEISENGGTTTARVYRTSADISSALIVNLASNDNGEASVDTTVTIAANEAFATFPITGVDDAIVDGTQNVTITASATDFVSGSDTLDISDDDTGFSVEADQQSVPEGNSGVTNFSFTITRSGVTTAAGSVDWAVSSSTATADDFVGGVLPSGQVTFAAGELSKTITVQVNGDTDAEADELFTVTLSNAVGTTIAGASASSTITNDDAANFKLQVLHASDLEGGVDAISRAANFATIVDALEADAAAQGIGSILLSAGDNYIPGPFFNASGDGSLRTPLQQANQTLFGEAGLTNIREGVGRVDISIMNILGFDAAAIGNHEFDAGPTTFAELIGSDIRGTNLSDVRWLGAEFPYLSSNLTFGSDGGLDGLFTTDILPNSAFQSDLGDLTGTAAQPAIAPATTILVNGELIGVVGATTQLLEQISSTGNTTVTGPNANDMLALAGILQPVINDLLDGADNTAGNADDINKVILVSHLQQVALEQSLIALLSGVDIVVAGGSDTLAADGNDVLRPGDTAGTQYPLFTTNADSVPAVIVSTDGEYSYVGRLVVEFSPAGILIAPATAEGAADANVNGAYATDDAGVVRVTGAADAATAIAASVKGTEVKKLTDAVSSVVTSKDSTVHGRVGVFLEGRREAVRTEETNMGNLTADANLSAARAVDPTVQVSLKNGGGIRAEIGSIDGFTGETGPTSANSTSGKLAGEVSQLDIENSLRFNNELTLVSVTPAELVTILEHAVSATAPGSTPGQFPQVGGLSFSFDPAQPAGSRIGSVAIVDELGNVVDIVQDGSGIAGDPARQIRMVTLNFLAGGGDGYNFDPNGDGNNLVATGIGEQVALAGFLSSNHSVVPYYAADTPVEQDRRIQNLSHRPDTVLSEVASHELPLTHISTLELSGAEISAFDPGSNRLFVTSGGGLEVVDFSDPHNPIQITLIDPVSNGAGGSGVTSVAVGSGASAGIVAIAVPASPDTDNGDVLFYDAATLAFLGAVEVGALPDMVTFTPDGTRLLVANEGESSDPEENAPGILPNPNGSVSLINVDVVDPSTSTVNTFDFSDASITFASLAAKGVRVNTTAPSAAADLEPEYITVQGNRAFIALQENNAVAVIDDVTTFTGFDIDDILPLGTKDHTLPFNALDTSDRDSGFEIRNAPVHGLFMPDAIDSYEVGGQTYFITANEGDGRGDADAGGDEARVKDYGDAGFPSLDPDALLFPADQLDDAVLGRIKSSSIDGDTDGDGDIDNIHVFGGRSFSIRDSAGNQVWDSGSFLERFTAQSGSFSNNRSDDKGPEPEGITVAQVGGMTFAFVGLERTSDVLVFNITDPANVQFVDNVAIAGDISPEGLTFIDAVNSPTGNPLLVITNEVSNTVTTLELASALTLNVDVASITENGTATATVTRAGDTSSSLTVTINNDDDGSEVSHPVSVIILAGETSATFAISGLSDSVVDGTQTVALTAVATSYSSGSSSLDITDVDSAMVSPQGTADAREDGLQNGQFVVTTTTAAEEDITVNYTVGGTATSGSDFTALSGSVVITAGTTSATIDVSVINDSLAEAIESLIITLDSVDSAGDVTVDAAESSDQIRVISDDLRVIKVTPATLTVSEDGTTATFDVTLGAQPAADVTVTVVSDDTGEATVSIGTLTFTSSNWNVPQTVTVTGIDDADSDGTQELDITLAIDAGASDSDYRFAPDVLIDVLNVDNEAPAAVVRLEDVTFFNQDAVLEDGLSPEQNGQRSIIRQVQVVLEGAVTISPASVTDGTFTLTNTDSGTPVELVFQSSTQVAGRTIVLFSFAAGANVDANGSLVDGNYRLDIDGSIQGFDADGSGAAGGTSSINFHRLFGDTDGDRDVDNADYGNLYRAFYGDSAYRNAFDRDDDDDLFDEMAAFFGNYGRILNP